MKYSVTYNGNTVNLNKDLIKEQNLSDDRVKRILTLHYQKMQIFEAMKKIDDADDLKKYDMYLNEIEFELQYEWGFDCNQKFFKFWERPKCTCPKMDNDDRYPTGYYITNSDCPLHGI